MKTAAAFALAGIIKDEELKPEYIIPSAFYPKAAVIVAEAVEKANINTMLQRMLRQWF